jgi:replicative DNA helicase
MNSSMNTDNPKLQPHDFDAEKAVLGAISIDPTVLANAQDVLTSNDFHDTRNRRIFEVMLELSGSSTIIDLLTVGDLLERKGHLQDIGGRGALAEWLTTVASASNIAHHARIVRDHAIRRRLIKFSVALAQKSYENGSTDDLLREAERGVSEITSGRDQRTWCSAADLAKETVGYVDRLAKRGSTPIGIPTGFHALDTLLGGWQRSDLIIMAARPSMGKTSLALGTALAAAEQGFHIGIVSLEMSQLQLGQRLHGMMGSIDIHALRTGALGQAGWWELAHTAQQVEALPLWVEDSSVLTADQLAAKARYLQTKNGLDLLIVDYLQLLQFSKAENRQQAVAEASRRLKLLAKELDIPVLALSQLSRSCEQRTNDRRPVLADLRDSGALEQDADVVLFIYREEVYNPDTDEKGVAEVLIRKHRNGPIGDRRLKFVHRFARFEDSDSD